MFNGGRTGVELADACVAFARDLPGVDVVIAPPFTALAAVADTIDGSPVRLAAQNIHPKDDGVSRGFALVRCTSCGDEMAVSFSCKLRGLCPSCAGRRMAGSAAHLVDRVLPSAPVRQYVLAFPYELSGLAATRPDVLGALSRIFWESLRGRYQAWAKGAGLAASGHGHRWGASRMG